MRTVCRCMPGANSRRTEKDQDKNFTDFFSNGRIAGEHHLM